MVVGRLGVSARDFWQMTPNEVGAVLNAHAPTHINGIRIEDYERMLDRCDELEAQGVRVL